MGKEKRRKKHPVPQPVVREWEFGPVESLPSGFDAVMGLIRPALLAQSRVAPSFAEVLAKTAAQPEVAFVRGVECGRQCCGGGHPRDGVLVAVPAPEVVALYRGNGADPAFRPVSVVVHDGHKNGARLIALLDVEDAKRFVNLIGEAIAVAEAQEVPA